MQIYFRLKNIPELEPLSRKERRRAWFATNGIVRHDRQVWFLGIGYLGFILICQVIGHLFDTRDLLLPIGVGIGTLVASQIFTHLKRPYLRDYINQLDND